MDNVFGLPRQFVFADFATDFSPTAANDLRAGLQTNVQMALATLGIGAAWQSAKLDLGFYWDSEFTVEAALEVAATPTIGTLGTAFWNPSTSSTAGTANKGKTSGVDEAYTGYSSNLSSSIAHLQPIGDMVFTVQATATVQQAVVHGSFTPLQRYGSLVFINGSGAALHSDDVECHIVMSRRHGCAPAGFTVRNTGSALVAATPQRVITVVAGTLPIRIPRIRCWTEGGAPAIENFLFEIEHHDSGTSSGAAEITDARPVNRLDPTTAEFAVFAGASEAGIGAYGSGDIRRAEPFHNQVGVNIERWINRVITLAPAEVATFWVTAPTSGQTPKIELEIEQPSG